MLKIGLTGGIGSGKSEVSKFFNLWGAYIFDADQEAKAIIDKNKIAQKEIIEEFGTDVVNKENKIERKKLARIAFQDDFHQSKLNAIVHPYVFKKIDDTKSGIILTPEDKNSLQKKLGEDHVIIAPIQAKDNILGYMILCNKETRHGAEAFTQTDLDLLSALCNQGAVALDNALLFKDITEATQFNESI